MLNWENDTLYLYSGFTSQGGEPRKSWTWQLPRWRVGYLIRKRCWRYGFSVPCWALQNFTCSKGIRMARMCLLNFWSAWFWFQITSPANLCMWPLTHPWATFSKFQCAALMIFKEGKLSLLPWVYNPNLVGKGPISSSCAIWAGKSHLCTPPRKVECLSVESWV